MTDTEQQTTIHEFMTFISNYNNTYLYEYTPDPPELTYIDSIRKSELIEAFLNRKDAVIHESYCN